MKITKAGWKPTRKGVEEMVEMMGDQISEDVVVIMFGLDNCTFCEENEEGDRSFPKPDKDGHYHVDGRVEVASPRQIKGLMKNCAPFSRNSGGTRRSYSLRQSGISGRPVVIRRSTAPTLGRLDTGGTWWRSWRRLGMR